MSESEPRQIQGRSEGRRESLLAEFLPGSLTLPPSFVATSPIVREILGRDIAECSSEPDDETHATPESDDESEHPSTQAIEPKLAFHPNGVAYGCGFSTVPLQGLDRPVPNPREVEESLQAELSLLRDNDIIPSKSSHSWTRRDSLPGRVYRHVFSTKTRDHEEPDFSGAAAETTPLLPDDSSIDELPTPPPNEIHERWEEAVATHSVKTSWQRETKTLVQYSAPLIATFLLHYSVTIGSVLTVGRLGMVELAAVNLATMTASITCYVPVQGLATCLDTLCAQAYGSGHKHLVGLQAQRMTWLLWILMVPIAFLWWFSEPILRVLVPGEETAALAALYLRVLIIGMPGVAAFESGKRFVQSQGLFHATTYTLLIGAPLSFLQNWFFVFKLGWHFAGAATAMAVTQNLLPILLILYVRFFEGSQCWNGFSKKAFRNWGPMIKLALPGMIMIEAQFSVLEILTIAAGQFGTAQLAAQSVLITITSTSFNIPFPLAIATSTRVANLIGANLSDAARTTAKVAIVAACTVGLFNLTIFATLRRVLPQVFTDDEEVIDVVSRVILVCALMQIFDALAAVSHGILRGVGRQAIGGYANLFSYYLVALPISLSTAFPLGWELAGLWFGVTIGLAVVSGLELLYLYHSDWDQAAAQAEARMRSEDTGNIEPKFTNA
ncbi:mate-domain-containing protein [Lasiosphaeria miniovina]|uniref:Mate-domain-containing protein n=1 Tax=Lasiosphaeria miniovina TaxID=1954250 RepID=A0AA40ATF6_9PEZI|nr:mate-domain-containing protein [Lasiosphaeria miniovina]KAK0721695.1 mate-domain-containing protein [Lasiosphaeria miniovina]